jgi:hypothetical protein
MRYCAIMSPERETCYEAFAIPSRGIITLAGIFDFQARAARKGQEVENTAWRGVDVRHSSHETSIASCPLLYRRDDGAAR